jgi:hypothetical protein
MSRFFLSIKEEPKIKIEYTLDIEDKIKPLLIELFGIKILSTLLEENGCAKAEFEGSENDIEEVLNFLAHLNAQHKVKSIDIDLNMN